MATDILVMQEASTSAAIILSCFMEYSSSNKIMSSSLTVDIMQHTLYVFDLRAQILS